MKGSFRHAFVYKFSSFILRPFIKFRFNYTYHNIKPINTPYIVIANHVTNYDPLFVGLSFRSNMYFVASDHLFRLGFISKVLNFIAAPIPRVKATTETQTVINIFRRLKDGHNICIFAEGNSTYSGQTGHIPKSIAKLARRSKTTLITYRLHGGYFSFPRWSKNVRKGKMIGEIAHEYTPDELSKLTDAEVYEKVCHDLYVDAYFDNLVKDISYEGNKLAENLEVALYCCPKCFKFATLKSKNDKVYCSCGLNLRYTDKGYLENFEDSSVPIKFDKITDWSHWQYSQLKDLVASFTSDKGDIPIFEDKNQLLYRTIKSKSNNLVINGTLKIFEDRFEIEGKNDKGEKTSQQFMFKDILDISIIIQMNIVFSTKSGDTYEIHSTFPRSALKYLHLYKIVTGKNI